MKLIRIFRGLLPVFLAEVLILLCLPASAAETTGYQPFFGLLHGHTRLSGGSETVENIFLQASEVEGLDFFAVTDYSHSLTNAQSGAIDVDGTQLSPDWAAGKAAAAAVTTETFLGIYGYEMAFRDMDGLGHITTLNTPGWISRNQREFDTLTAYYDALTTVPGSVSQFSHPDWDLGYFENFDFRTDSYDDAISLLELSSSLSCSFYNQALKQGWHVAPTLSGKGFRGIEGNLRTVVLAEQLTGESLYESMRNRRCYATQDRDLVLSYTLNGAVMGSIVPWAETISIEISATDETDSGGASIEVVSGGKTVQTARLSGQTLTLTLSGKAGYYYLRITQADGDMAVTAPVWMEEKKETPPQETTLPQEPSEPESSEPESSEPDPSEPEPSEPSQPEAPESPMEDLDIRFCFGLLHGHTASSDGSGTPEEAYAAAARYMDFYAVTDHSNSFDNALSGELSVDAAAVSQIWAMGKAAAQSATTSDFVGIFGYEMTWPDNRNLGHIVTFSTPGFLSRNREDMENLTDYYDALTEVPGSVSQFCHPELQMENFEGFAHHSAAYDEAMTLLEIGGETGFDALGSYFQALDAGWHLSPTASHNDHEGNFGSLNPSRTVILVPALTEDALYEAMRQRRTYATQDQDLCLYYTLDGHLMGGILPAGDSHQLSLRLFDATDGGAATVELLCDGGARLLSCPMPQSGELTLTVPGGKQYYLLRITQPDGDIAVTAPVWTNAYDNITVEDFSSDTLVPVPGQEISLTLTVSNGETLPLFLETLTLSDNGTAVYRLEDPGTVEPGASRTFTIPYSRNEAGAATLQLTAEGTIGGFSRQVTAQLTLHFRAREMVKGILVDLGHSSHDAGDFDNLKTLAQDANMTLTCFTGQLPEDGSILILPPAARAYEPDFLQQVKIFCARGGALVVCGTAEENPHGNQLLLTIGSTMQLGCDTAVDPVHNGGTPDRLYPTTFNTDTPFCEDIGDEQYYVHLSGATVDAGQGLWLVRGDKTTLSSETGETGPVLLAWEERANGGHILTAGSLFLGDESMPLPKNRWAAPTANQRIAEALLGITREEFPITSIKDVRQGKENTLYHIQGFTTSGTANRYNTFPDTLYLQDDTGGIPIVPFRQSGVAVGTPMVAAGYLKRQDGNLVFLPVDYDFPEEPAYRYVPETLNHSRATDYAAYGGQLLQVEAKVISLTVTEDGLGVRRFTLEDAWGDRITVLIEDYIFSGAYGTNTLTEEVKIGRTVRAMGLLHIDENGIPVLRVRNCEEVVWVPPIPRPEDRQNPYTGDLLPVSAALCIASGQLLALLLKKRKNKVR